MLFIVLMLMLFPVQAEASSKLVSMHDNSIQELKTSNPIQFKTILKDKSVPNYYLELERMIARKMDEALERRNLGNPLNIETRWVFQDHNNTHRKTKKQRKQIWQQ